jgi:hypothetical protein
MEYRMRFQKMDVHKDAKIAYRERKIYAEHPIRLYIGTVPGEKPTAIIGKFFAEVIDNYPIETFDENSFATDATTEALFALFKSVVPYLGSISVKGVLVINMRPTSKVYQAEAIIVAVEGAKERVVRFPLPANFAEEAFTPLMVSIADAIVARF